MMDKKLIVLQKQQLLDLALPELTFLQEDFYGDFYDYFLNFLKFERLRRQISPEKMRQMKLFLYLNLDRQQTKAVNYAYRLVFDAKLNFIKKEANLTIWGWLKRKKPDSITYKTYQQDRQKAIAKIAAQLASQNTADKIKHFNVLMGKLFTANHLGTGNVAYLLA